MTNSNTSGASSIQLSETAKAILPISHGLVLVSEPAHSGKTTTVNLLAEAFEEKHGNRKDIAYLNFRGETSDIDRQIYSFSPFVPALEASLATDEEKKAEATRRAQWGHSVLMSLAFKTPWVVVIDDIPESLFQEAVSLSLTGTIVIASLPANSAEDALEKYTSTLEAQGDKSAKKLVKMAVEGSIWQQLIKDQASGEFVLDTYGIDVSKDMRAEVF